MFIADVSLVMYVLVRCPYDVENDVKNVLVALRYSAIAS